MAELKNIRIAVSGIYDYALEELPTLRLPLPGQGAPDWAEKKQIYKIYRPAFVLAAACDKFKMLPLTHHHPNTPVDGQNFRKLAVGYTGENPFIDWIKDTDEVGIRSTVMIYDDEALNAYERGEIQLSPGYVASFEWQKGKAPDGQEYDIVMKEITDVNHIALLPAGRGGEYAVVMDGAKREPSVFDLARTKDGAPKGNDNASKDHVNKEEKSNDEWRAEIKQELKPILHTDIKNEATGINAKIAMEGLNKMTSGPAIKKSVDNGFTGSQHFEAVKKIVDLYKKARLIKTHADKNGSKDVQIKRFVAQDKMKDGTNYDALITVKESVEHGHRIYSLELDEINKAALRWTVNDDGTLTPEDKPSTGNLQNTITDTAPKVKSVFEIAAGSVFDRVKFEVLKNSLFFVYFSPR